MPVRYFTPHSARGVLWGDYGQILAHGMSRHLPREGGLIQLERTSPFIPPMTAPGIVDVVMTTALRNGLEAAGFSGLGFRPVIKRHIVHLDWEAWDRSASLPPELPANGEPEGYILDRPHSPEAAEALGDLWELSPTQQGRAETRPEGLTLIGPSAEGADFVLAPLGRYEYVLISERAAEWIRGQASPWIDFREFLVADA